MLIDESDIVWDVERRHLREAEFCLGLTRSHLDTHVYTLEELAAGPERRLLAHVEALVAGGPIVAQRLLLATIDDEEEDRDAVAAATLALLRESDPRVCEHALAVLDDDDERERSDRQRAGVVLGLQMIERDGMTQWLAQTVGRASGLGLACRLTALAGRGARPGPWLSACLASEDLPVARAAATLARFVPLDEPVPELLALAESPDPELRRVTLETALLRRVPGAYELARYWAFCPGDSPFRRDALTWVACLGDADAHARLLACLDDADQRADALWAAGFCGRVAAVDHCVALLADEDHGQLAAEVAVAIAGLPVDDERLWLTPSPVVGAEPERALPDLDADDLDADLVPTSDELLPIPNPDAVTRWWQERRAGLDPSQRLSGGGTLDGHRLSASLWTAPMRRRHALAFELGVRSRRGELVSTRGPCSRQRRQLRTLPDLRTLDTQAGIG